LKNLKEENQNLQIEEEQEMQLECSKSILDKKIDDCSNLDIIIQ